MGRGVTICKLLYSGHYPIDRVRPYEDSWIFGSTCDQRASRHGQDQTFGSTFLPNGLHQSHRCRWRRGGSRPRKRKEGKEINHSLNVLINIKIPSPVHSLTAIWSDGLHIRCSRSIFIYEISHSKANWWLINVGLLFYQMAPRISV